MYLYYLKDMYLFMFRDEVKIFNFSHIPVTCNYINDCVHEIVNVNALSNLIHLLVLRSRVIIIFMISL